MKKYLLFLGMVGALLLPHTLHAQSMDSMHVRAPNLKTFPEHAPDLGNLLDSLSSAEAKSHPEYGIVPYDVVGDNLIELLDQRTIDERHFVNKYNTHEIFVQKAFGNLHYVDEAGRYISYDPHLAYDPIKERFRAPHQETPTFLDVSQAFAGFETEEGDVMFNHHLRLLNVTSAGDTLDFGLASWATMTKGQDGAYITDAWPGIDIEMVYEMRSIKTSFVIEEHLALFTSGELIIMDELGYGDTYTLGYQYEYGEMHGKGWDGPVTVSSSDPTLPLFTFSQGIAFDHSWSTATADMPRETRDSIKALATKTLYSISGNKLLLKIPVSWLNDPIRQYPVIIDPLVTSSGTYTLGVMEFHYNGAFCGGTGDCTYSLTVSYPAAITMTGATMNAIYVTTVGSCALSCWLLDAGFYVTSTSCPSGKSPGGTGIFWSCPTGAGIGTCTGSGLNIFTDLFGCGVTPVCSGSATFTIHNSYCYCNSGGASCTGALPCQSMNNNTWSIMLAGHTLEVTSNAVTVTPGCCVPATLNPHAVYGVKPYAYKWTSSTTGATIISTDSTFTKAHCASTSLYPYSATCVITDACGNSQTVVFTYSIDCGLLEIELVDFSGAWSDDHVTLAWQTLSEKENDYFAIERSQEGLSFEPVGFVDGQGTTSKETSYVFEDMTAPSGENYYRLKTVDMSNSIAYSDAISVTVPEKEEALPFPNPTRERITFRMTGMEDGDIVHIRVVDVAGKTVYEENAVNHGGYLSIPTKGFASGAYTALIEFGSYPYRYSFVKE